jgi:hypothetical protein
LSSVASIDSIFYSPIIHLIRLVPLTLLLQRVLLVR